MTSLTDAGQASDRIVGSRINGIKFELKFHWKLFHSYTEISYSIPILKSHWKLFYSYTDKCHILYIIEPM